MGHYIANLRDIEFCLFDLLGRDKVLGTSLYSEIDRETAVGMLEEVKRMCGFQRRGRIYPNVHRQTMAESSPRGRVRRLRVQLKFRF